MIRVSLASVAACMLWSCSTARPSSERPLTATGVASVAAAGSEQSSTTVRATVVRVEPKRRVVTLELPDGQRVTVRAHTRIKNLEKLTAGDMVTATYYESVAYAVKKAGAAKVGLQVGEAGAVAPGAGEARAVTVTAHVSAVDHTTGTVTLAAADAHPVTIRARNPATLTDIGVGDVVEITYTEAVAVEIAAPP